MIRDPSDGSVRPNPGDVKTQEIASSKTKNTSRSSGLLSTSGSGLPAPADSEKAAETKRIDRSREWLKNYHEMAHLPRASNISPELDKAIQDELDHPAASIMKEG